MIGKTVYKATRLLICHPFRFTNLLIESINSYSCFIMVCLYKKKKVIRQKSSLPEVVVLLADDVVIKISWKKEVIKREYENMNLAMEQESIRDMIPPHHYSSCFLFKILEIKRCLPLKEDEIFGAARAILNRFAYAGSLVKSPSLSNFKQIQKGIEVVGYIKGCDVKRLILNRVNDILEFGLFAIGPAHGDFHQGNILKDNDNKYVIIDLDCYRKYSIQDFDVLYFVLQFYVNKNQLTWYKQLLKLIDTQIFLMEVQSFFSKEFCSMEFDRLSLLFFLDRIGQETMYVNGFKQMPLKEICEVIDWFLTKQINLFPITNTHQ